MSFLDRFRKRDREVDANTVDDVLLRAIINGEDIKREDALTLPAVSGAVDFISGTIASMPVKLYKYKNGKAVYVDKFYCGNYSFINYPGHKGIIIHYTHMGYETFSTIYLKNGKIKSTDYGSRDAGMDDYVNLKTLSYHMTSNGNWNL